MCGFSDAVVSTVVLLCLTFCGRPKTVLCTFMASLLMHIGLVASLGYELAGMVGVCGILISQRSALSLMPIVLGSGTPSLHNTVMWAGVELRPFTLIV